MLTPLDIESKVFSKSIGGYSVSEVKIFVKDILAHYEKLYKENIELKDKLNTVNEGIQYYKTIEETLQHTLLLAEKMAEETRASARKSAEQTEREAQLKADVIVNDAKHEVYRINAVKEELIYAYDSSKVQLKQFLKSQLEMVEKTDLDLKYHQNAYEMFLKNNTMAANKKTQDETVDDDIEVFEEEIKEIEETETDEEETDEEEIIDEYEKLIEATESEAFNKN